MFFYIKINFKIKFWFVVFSSILVCLVYLNTDSDYKWRYFNQIELLFKKDGLTKYLDNSQYGAHRNVAKEIFLDNPIFGSGIKNFRVESAKKIYEDLQHKKNHLRVSNHPHELYYEFLSETGLFGYSAFLTFIIFSLFFSIKNYLLEKNTFQLSGILFVLTSIIPLLPSGSFFSTYSSSFFWINYAVMMGYINYKKFYF